MSHRILTTHAGSLPRPEPLVALHRQRLTGESSGDDLPGQVAEAVTEVVRRQREIGIDLVNDGEYGHSMGHRYDFAAWWTYVFARLSGLELVESSVTDVAMAPPKPGQLALATFSQRRDRTLFSDAYGDPTSGCALPEMPNVAPMCRGPISYSGHQAVQQDIAHFKAALAAEGLDTGFLNAVAPGSASRFGNEYYDSDEALIYACADALREEYTAIIDAGLGLQLDDPGMAENWDSIVPEPTVDAYKRFTRLRVEALNWAIRDLPVERIRFHLCWGSWHGPHVTDLPLADIVDVLLEINAGAYSFEAANPRHEHEWAVWRDVALPEGKTILPGVVSHCTNVVEHPDLVCERIMRFAQAVGEESVVASTDCGLGGRVHPQIAWAKLQSLVDGAARASERLASATSRR